MFRTMEVQFECGNMSHKGGEMCYLFGQTQFAISTCLFFLLSGLEQDNLKN